MGEKTRRASPCPAGQVTGAAAAVIDRSTSNRSVHVGHRYS